ncbi:MAG: hypothetical protein MUO21_00915 [Nitrososphaeraceae archaeon]|nr:hypothetical protein [Nitrososphaeraceae archaeon]
MNTKYQNYEPGSIIIKVNDDTINTKQIILLDLDCGKSNIDHNVNEIDNKSFSYNPFIYHSMGHGKTISTPLEDLYKNIIAMSNGMSHLRYSN